MKKAKNAGVKVFIGFVLLFLGVSAVVVWVDDLFTVVRGCAGLALLGIGAVVVALSRE